MPVTMLTIAEYARHRGCNEKAVRKALAEGRITRISQDKRCLDPAVADIQWAANTRARADSGGRGGAPSSTGSTAAGEGAIGYGDHRARRERAEADRAELLAVREREQALLREPAERAIFEAFRGLRDAGFQAMRDVAPTVRDLTEVREIQLALEDALRRAFLSFEAAMTKRLAELAKEARP